MKIYLSSRFEHRHFMKRYAEGLHNLGHEITSTWIDGESYVETEDNWRHAEQDLHDVIVSEAFVTFNGIDAESPGTGGRHVELGVAISTGCHLLLVGEKENIFHYLNDIQVIPHPEVEAAVAETVSNALLKFPDPRLQRVNAKTMTQTRSMIERVVETFKDRLPGARVDPVYTELSDDKV